MLGSGARGVEGSEKREAEKAESNYSRKKDYHPFAFLDSVDFIVERINIKNLIVDWMS